MVQKKIFKVIPRVQHYSWGGTTFIPNLVGQHNEDAKPYAELWMGTHRLCPSWIQVNEQRISLLEWIDSYKEEMLGSAVAEQFHELPYLFKVLDVDAMLSIQVHPTKQQAIAGFREEEAKGIAADNPGRNYKDRNHKPEVMVALSDFWLLHGFKEKEQLLSTLEVYPSFFELLPIFTQQSYNGLYTYIMNISQDTVDKILKPLVETELGRADQLSPSDPGWWLCKLFKKQPRLTNLDRGIFSIYFFNLVHLKKGEAIFQAAGVPHAYLQGQNVELMANSDNVIRGGLTDKHIDPKELVKLTKCEGIRPQLLTGQMISDIEKAFICPAAEFSISQVTVRAGSSYRAVSRSFEMWLVLEGEISVEGITFSRGEVIGIAANTTYELTSVDKSMMFKAFVPV